MYECMDYQFYQGFYIPICWVVPNMLRETEPWLLIKERMNGEDSDIQDVLIRRESLSKLMKPNLLDIDGGDDLWSLFIETIEILPTVMIKFNHSGKERVLLSEENLTRAIDQLEIQYTPKNLGPLLEECHNKENMVRSE